MINRRWWLLILAVALALGIGSPAHAIPLLSNDAGRTLTPGDSLFPHLEYGEELKRGEIERELERETREAPPEDVADLINQVIPGGSRTGFLSDATTSVALPFVGNAFSYYHQLPPMVDPDVTGPLKFNDFDFRTDLIEFEFELEGRRSGSGSFEVRLQQGGVDIASLGALSFDSEGKFEFKFKEMVDYLGGSGIAPEIYTAIGDGILDLNIVRTSGTANLYLKESELELETPYPAGGPSTVPEPGTLFLLGSGLLGAAAWRRRKR